MRPKVLGLLGLGKRAGTVCAGEEPAQSAVSHGKAKLLLVSSDAGAHTVRWVQNSAVPLLRLPVDKLELGQALGMRSCAVLAMVDAAMALAVAQSLECTDEALLSRLQRQAKPRQRK